MSIDINDQLKNLSGKSLDSKAGKIQSGKTVPYTSVSEANSLIPSAYRYKGLEVFITVAGETVKHWYKSGVTDGDLVPFGQVVFGDSFDGSGTPEDPYEIPVNNFDAMFDARIRAIDGYDDSKIQSLAHRYGVFRWVDGTGDTTAPSLLSATVENSNKNQIILTLSEELVDGLVYDSGDFTFSQGKTLSTISIVDNIITLIVNSNFAYGDVITFSYSGNGFVDLSGNSITFSNQAVVNNIVAPPTTTTTSTTTAPATTTTTTTTAAPTTTTTSTTTAAPTTTSTTTTAPTTTSTTTSSTTTSTTTAAPTTTTTTTTTSSTTTTTTTISSPFSTLLFGTTNGQGSETGGVYTSDSGFLTDYQGYSVKHMTTSTPGYIGYTYNSGDPDFIILGLTNAGTYVSYTGMLVSFYNEGGNIKARDGSGTTTVGAAVNGTMYILKQTNAPTWTWTLHTSTDGGNTISAAIHTYTSKPDDLPGRDQMNAVFELNGGSMSKMFKELDLG